jgi:glycosyltransferase involved in cell wall biosynthesis
MAEALACGTPVVALGAGSVPEVVGDGVTGFVCASEDGIVEAVTRLDRIDRAWCRAVAERRCSAAAMADGYERVYDRLLTKPEGGRVDPGVRPHRTLAAARSRGR